MLLIWMSGSLLDARILACARKTTFLMTFGAALAHALTYEEEQVYNVLKVFGLEGQCSPGSFESPEDCGMQSAPGNLSHEVG